MSKHYVYVKINKAVFFRYLRMHDLTSVEAAHLIGAKGSQALYNYTTKNILPTLLVYELAKLTDNKVYELPFIDDPLFIFITKNHTRAKEANIGSEMLQEARDLIATQHSTFDEVLLKLKAAYIEQVESVERPVKKEFSMDDVNTFIMALRKKMEALSDKLVGLEAKKMYLESVKGIIPLSTLKKEIEAMKEALEW